MTLCLRIGQTQAAALDLYVLDPAVVDGAEFMGEPVLRATITGAQLTIENDDLQEAYAAIVEGANSADNGDDAEFRDALTAVAARVLRATVQP